MEENKNHLNLKTFNSLYISSSGKNLTYDVPLNRKIKYLTI